jgi:hypothetical protein
MDAPAQEEKERQMSLKPERVTLRDSLAFTIHATITDAAVFNHYILKEYAPRCQGVLSQSRSPAKHTIENCLYDEMCGWLDAPAITGISVLDIRMGDSAFINHSLSDDPRINFREIVDLLYDVCKLQASARGEGSTVSVDKVRLEQLKERCRWLLKNVDKVGSNEPATAKAPGAVGAGVRAKRDSGGLPPAP